MNIVVKTLLISHVVYYTMHNNRTNIIQKKLQKIVSINRVTVKKS
jgi:hypothetical protein